MNTDPTTLQRQHEQRVMAGLSGGVFTRVPNSDPMDFKFEYAWPTRPPSSTPPQTPQHPVSSTLRRWSQGSDDGSSSILALHHDTRLIGTAGGMPRHTVVTTNQDEGEVTDDGLSVSSVAISQYSWYTTASLEIARVRRHRRFRLSMADAGRRLRATAHGWRQSRIPVVNGGGSGRRVPVARGSTGRRAKVGEEHRTEVVGGCEAEAGISGDEEMLDGVDGIGGGQREGVRVRASRFFEHLLDDLGGSGPADRQEEEEKASKRFFGLARKKT